MFVIDNGTCNIRAEYAGKFIPNFISNVLGVPKGVNLFPKEIFGKDIYIGKECQQNRGALQLYRPMKAGVVQDWEHMEKIWSDILKSHRVETNQSFVLSDSIINVKSQKENTAEIFLEEFSASNVTLCSNVLATMFGSGKTTGISVCVGDGSTSIGLIDNGTIVRPSLVKSPCGGHLVSKLFRETLMNGGQFFARSASDLEFVREMKENVTFVLEKSEREDPCEIDYELPDGRVIQLDRERFLCNEMYFDSQRWQMTAGEYNLQSLIAKSINQTFGFQASKTNGPNSSKLKEDKFYQEIWKNIVLEGGSCCLKGFSDRLTHEISTLTSRDAQDFKIHSSNPSGTIWTGLTIISGLDSFKQYQMSRQDLQEFGKSYIVEKSSPLFK